MVRIYARSCFTSEDVPEPALFHSMLSIDTLAECALDPSYVHVITSASKDFAVNGFRLGVLVSQHNPELQRAMSCVGILSQSASPKTDVDSRSLTSTRLHFSNTTTSPTTPATPASFSW